jgi:hypothetical protein
MNEERQTDSGLTLHPSPIVNRQLPAQPPRFMLERLAVEGARLAALSFSSAPRMAGTLRKVAGPGCGTGK